MAQWQVTATMENGAVVMFGTKADTDELALDTAHDRLADAGQLVIGLEVRSLG